MSKAHFAITMVAPTVNINGNTKASLMADHLAAKKALEAAVAAFREIAPHGRNYPGQEDSYRYAREAYVLRLAALQEMVSDVYGIAIAIHQQS